MAKSFGLTFKHYKLYFALANPPKTVPGEHYIIGAPKAKQPQEHRFPCDGRVLDAWLQFTGTYSDRSGWPTLWADAHDKEDDKVVLHFSCNGSVPLLPALLHVVLEAKEKGG